jgi:hypothetical protein
LDITAFGNRKDSVKVTLRTATHTEHKRQIKDDDPGGHLDSHERFLAGQTCPMGKRCLSIDVIRGPERLKKTGGWPHLVGNVAASIALSLLLFVVSQASNDVSNGDHFGDFLRKSVRD